MSKMLLIILIYVQSTWKVLISNLHPFFVPNIKKPIVFHTHSTSQLRLATLQGLKSYTPLMAIVLDSAGLKAGRVTAHRHTINVY